MKQWQVEPKSAEPLSQVEVAAREPGPGETRIRVHAASLNFRDQLLLRGTYPTGRDQAIVPLSDGAGEVVGVGPGVTGFAVGDRVTATTVTNWIDGPFAPAMGPQSIGFSVDGWLTEEIILPETALVKLPDAFGFTEAATLPCAGVTAWNAVIETARLGPGQRLLALGTGGVSMFAVQLAKLVGADAFITSSSDDKLERARALGADVGINYRTHPDWETQVLSLTGGEGVDVVIENVGSLRQSVHATRYGGMVAVIGMLAMLAPGGSRPDGDLSDLLRTGVTVTPIMMGSRRMLSRMVHAYDRHAITPVIDQRFPFANAPDAYHALAEAKHMGKLVVTV